MDTLVWYPSFVVHSPSIGLSISFFWYRVVASLWTLPISAGDISYNSVAGVKTFNENNFKEHGKSASGRTRDLRLTGNGCSA